MKLIEDDDGSVSWDAVWDPSRPGEGEPVAVEWQLREDGTWDLFQVWVRDAGGSVTMYDVDWSTSSGSYFYHDAGGGKVYASKYTDPSPPTGRLWRAPGVKVYDDGRELSDADLLAHGIQVIDGPTPDPLGDAIDGRVFWCAECDDMISDDDGAECGLCESMTHVHVGSPVVITSDEHEVARGLYKVLSKPFMVEFLVGGGYFLERALERIGDLPDGVDTDYEGSAICAECMKRTPGGAS